MSLVVPIIAVLGGVVALVAASPLAASLRRRAAQAAVGVGWLGVIVGVAGVYFGALSGVSTLVGAAACGGLAVLPAGIKLESARDYGTASGAVIALAAGVSGLFVQGAAPVVVSQVSLLYVAYAGAAGAAIVCALIACVLCDAAEHGAGPAPGVGAVMAVVGLAGAGGLLLFLRGGLAGRSWLPEMLPELCLWAAGALVALVAGLYRRRLGRDPERRRAEHLSVFSLHGRDYALRAVVLGWLVILLSGLIHWNHFGTAGVGSPSEWNAVGAVLAMTGLLLIGWTRRSTRPAAIARQIAPAALFAVLVITMVVSVGFDAPFGHSIVF